VRLGPACVALSAALGVVVLAAAARADDAPAPESMSAGDRRALSAFAAGAAALAMPLAIGGVRMASTSRDLPWKNSGWLIAGAGLSLAPIASHLAVRSYDRAALFGAVPAAATIGIGVEVAVNPKALYDGDTGSRTLFAFLFSGTVLVSALGVLDAAHPLWGDDPDKVHASLHLAPGRLAIEGTW
jgi:hypothetical protein